MNTKIFANNKSFRAISIIFLSLLVCAFLVVPSSATIGQMHKGDLQGTWQIALVGFTGCGQTSMLVKTTLNASGVDTNATLTMHGQCGDSVLTGQTFTILTLGVNGMGTAGLSCGPGCGWEFNIQVSPDRAVFNLVDVAVQNPNNFLGGTAVHN